MDLRSPAPHCALRALDVLLESSADPQRGTAAPSNGTRHHVISLLRCVVLEQHLELVLGAIERAIPPKSLGHLQFAIVHCELEVNGQPSLLLEIEAIARVRRLRTRVLNAVLPAVVTVDPSPCVNDFLSPTIGPIALRDIGGRRIARSVLTVRKVGIYTVEGPDDRDRKLLRSIMAPLPGNTKTHRRRVS